MGVEVTPHRTNISICVPHPSHHFTPGASRCCTVARETGKRSCTKSFLLLKLLGAVEEKGRFLQAVGGVDMEPAPLPRAPPRPSLAVSECHISVVFCCPPQFHIATSSYPRGSFHFLEVKAMCNYRTTSLAPFLPYTEGEGWDLECSQFFATLVNEEPSLVILGTSWQDLHASAY